MMNPLAMMNVKRDDCCAWRDRGDPGTAGFAGVARGITGGAIPGRPLLPNDAIGPADAGRSGARGSAGGMSFGL